MFARPRFLAAVAICALAAFSSTVQAKQVSEQVNKYGQRIRTTRWTAGNTSFAQVTTYQSRDTNRINYSKRYAKKLGDRKATIHFRGSGSFPGALVAKGKVWGLRNGVKVKHTSYFQDGKKQTGDSEVFVQGKRRTYYKGALIRPGHINTIKEWKTGRGNVLGINREVHPDGSYSITRFGQKELSKMSVPTFIGD
jgi:Tfp pilus assembly protein FimT